MQEPNTFSDELRRYMALLLQWAWLLVLAGLLAGGAAYLTSARMTPLYRASALVLINEAPSTKLDYTAVITSERLAQTYAEVMTTRPVLEGVVERLGMQLSVGYLQGAVQVTPVRDTQLIRVEVEDTNPALAAMIANALVAEFAEQNLADQASRFAASKQNLETRLSQLEEQMENTAAALDALDLQGADSAEVDRLEATLARYQASYASILQSYESVRLAEAQSISTVLQKEPAVAPSWPVSPNVMRNTLLAAAVGLMMAAGLVLLLEAMDDTIRDPAEAERHLGLPVLGLIAGHKDNRPVTAAQPRSQVAEAFRALRTNLQFTRVEAQLRTLLVTSPSPKDGKSTVAANLAVVLAQGGQRVALLDADLRRPYLHNQFGLLNQDGMSSLFLGPQKLADEPYDLDEKLQLTETPGLRVLTSGRLPPNPAELLGSEKMLRIIGQALEISDMVLIDSPPVLAVTDAAVLAPHVDGVVLVVKPGETKLAACRQAVEQLRRVGANLLGVVFNDVDVKRLHYYHPYKDYYASYGTKGRASRSRAGEEITPG
jgi:non-specific protein-tyrosine kinase